jgi:hypothetical protein
MGNGGTEGAPRGDGPSLKILNLVPTAVAVPPYLRLLVPRDRCRTVWAFFFFFFLNCMLLFFFFLKKKVPLQLYPDSY